MSTEPFVTEQTEIIYESGTAAEALRAVADRFAADPDLVLIGLWNIEPVEPLDHGCPEAYLQVVVTHLTPGSDGGGT